MNVELDALNEALKAVSSLRSCVGNFFLSLSQGVRSEHGEDHRETKYILELQDLVAEISSNMRKVEQTCSSIPLPPDGQINLGNTAHLAHETTQDRQALYSELVGSYKWTDKLHEISNITFGFLAQNVMKRSYNSYLNSSGMNAKRRRLTPSCHNVPISSVETVITAIDRQYQDMNMNVYRPHPSNCHNLQIQVSLGRILRAVISFRGMMIEWVKVKAYNEEFQTDNGQLGQLDLWTNSRHHVFRKITENANAAMLHFYSPTLPDLAVRSFMTWLHSFRSLFTDTCRRCGNHLLCAMPPTWRDFRTLEAFHEDCKP
ncbi:Hypothetical predicted protein [Cloeon dipterum]|uniref:Mediator of RNA polymerase II transcription subunit 27 n=1 Tax=Cloeon dipterum TaxID=197152 RepID=A0A8S1D623_9INSE|nr:Hypothetical predicted protein [Cloeon dipterum]